MKRSYLVKGLCVALAGLMIFSLGGCKKKSTSVAADAKKNAKNAVFKKEIDISADFGPTSAKANGNHFVLMRSDSGSFAYAVGNMDGSVQPAVTINLDSESNYVSSMNVELASDGSVFFIDGLSDYENNEFAYKLVHYSADGNKLAEADLGSESVYGTAVLSDSTFVIRYENELQVFDSNLNKTKTIPNTNASQNWNDIIPNGKELYLFMNESGTGNSVHKVDVVNGTVGAAIPYTAKSGTNLPGDGYDFYISSSGNGISGVNLSQNTITEVFNFMDSNIDTSQDLNVKMFDAEHALVMSDPYSENAFISIYKKVPPAEVPDKEYLTLGGFYINSDTKKIIAKFNDENSKYKIRVIDYSEYNTMDNNYTGGNTKFKGDAATGGLPDIIMTDNLPNVESYINKNMFMDLTPMMEQNGLKKSDYLDNIIEAGSKDGKLFMLVPFYHIQGFMLKRQYANSNNSISIDDYMALEKQFNIAGKSMYYIPKNTIIDYAMSYSTSDFLDVKTGKCNFDSEDFQKILMFANEFPADKDLEQAFSNVNYLGAFANDEMLLVNYGMGSFRDTYRYEQSVFGQEAAFTGFPNAKGNSRPVILPDIAVAISAKSTNKEGAFEFVKMLLSEDFQTNIDNGIVNTKGLPILKSAFDAMGETAKEPYAYKNAQGEWEKVEDENNTYEIRGKTFVYKELSQEHLDYLKNVAKSATNLKFKEDKITNLISEESAAYFSGQKSAADVTKIINSRVDIYVKENQ